jgi:pimeloyl-ACP methyl ester carboxylesterase
LHHPALTLQQIPTVNDSVVELVACLAFAKVLCVLPVCLLSCVTLPQPMQTIPTVDDSVGVVLAALQRHGIASSAVLGHSYGSLVAARLVRVAPQVVHTLAVVDPVSGAAAVMSMCCAAAALLLLLLLPLLLPCCCFSAAAAHAAAAVYVDHANSYMTPVEMLLCGCAGVNSNGHTCHQQPHRQFLCGWRT